RRYAVITAYNGGAGSVLRVFSNDKIQAANIINTMTPEAMFLVILINSFAYMPTLGLINTISYYRLQNAGM
ncbi:hypothetical protein UY868_25460, partial [Escherichia coli]|nr:hypothetical protein [Escherichia coli]